MSSAGVQQSSSNSGPTILVCESNKELQSLVHSWLWTMGVNHKQVFSAENAIAACGKHKYDMILLDLDSQWNSSIIPNGIDAVRILRQIDGPNKYTPVVGWVMTPPMMAPPMGLFLEDYNRHGFNDILRKPSSKEALEALIKKWVGQKVENSTVNSGEGSNVLFDLGQLPLPDFVFSEEPITRQVCVLVVEDCTLTQHVITSLLKELTPNVSQAYDGEQAIKLCDENQFDIIFMDMGLPKIDGLTATQRIRKVGKNTWVPIIAFTSKGSLQDYRTIGVDDMLQKPFSTESLSQIFDKWTEHARGNASGNTLPPPGNSGGMMPQGQPVMPGISQATLTPQMMPVQMPNNGTEGLGMNYGNHSAGKAKKDAPRNAHNIKERQRRQDISQAADNLRKIVPTLASADKATVYKTTVAYVNFLRQNIEKQSLEELDAAFERQLEKGIQKIDNVKTENGQTKRETS